LTESQYRSLFARRVAVLARQLAHDIIPNLISSKLRTVSYTIVRPSEWVLSRPTRARGTNALRPTRPTDCHRTPAPERREWQQVLRLLGNSRTADGQVIVLDEEGCVELLYPRFAAATTLYLFPGLATRKDVDRKLHQLSKASIVVVPSMEPLYQDFLRWWPQFSSALEPFQPIMQGTFFTVYRRRPERLPATVKISGR
jgi:hypothetical protein